MTANPKMRFPGVQGGVLRWLGLALAVVAMLAGGLNLIVAPWGLGGGTTQLGFQMLSYIGSHEWLVEDFHPLVQNYLDGFAIPLFVIGVGCAVTVGMRSGWTRWVGLTVELVVVLFLVLRAWSSYNWGDDYADPVWADRANDHRIFAVYVVGLAAVAAVAAVALAVRAHRLHDGIAVVYLLMLAGLHLWSVSSASTVPESDPSTPANSGLRLTFLAWTPAVWFLLAAAGALLAALGAARLRGGSPWAVARPKSTPVGMYPTSPRM